VKDYGVDWLLQDGENMVKQCWSTSHTHREDDSNYSNAVDGLNEIQRVVKAAVPNLLWENCEDGGNMQTYSMVGHYVTSIVNDNSNPRITRQSIYGATYALPPRFTDRYMEGDPYNSYSTRTHFFGGPLILMNKITWWPEYMSDYMQSEALLYKSIRTSIRDGKVFHLSARPDGKINDAIESYNPAQDRALVFVYREEGEQDREVIKPRGLSPDRTYEVRLREAGTRMIATGRSLAETGIVVPLPDRYTAEIVFIDRVVQPLPPALTFFDTLFRLRN
jgi:hypothetical protein